jgi:hypothetical protein
MWGEAGDDRIYAHDDRDDYVSGGTGWDYADVDEAPWYAPWQAEDSLSSIESKTEH